MEPYQLTTSDKIYFPACPQNVIIHENLEEILLPPQSDLKLEIIKPSMGLEDLLDNLLRTWHPKILSVVSSPSSEFPKV